MYFQEIECNFIPTRISESKSTYTQRKLPKRGTREERDETCLGSCVVLLKQSCFFEKRKLIVMHFFSFNLYTVDLTL